MQFEILERVGTSTESQSDAIKKVVEAAHKEKPIAWFEVIETRGRVQQDNKIEYQVVVKIGRKID